MSMIEVIPIVLLHHDEAEVLVRAVESIKERTLYPFELFVVDNATQSSNQLNQVFSMLETRYQVHLIRNPKNNWIYGFNLALNHKAWPKSSLYAFSDADIYVPTPHSNLCWLGNLVEQMNTHCSIGKLGLPLSVDNLKKNHTLKNLLAIEEGYYHGPKIGDNVVAPVDTTMALYRSDFFITSFKFQIGHNSLSKPQYYVCRASKIYEAIHVGWDYYPNNGLLSYPKKKYWNKSLVMATHGAYIAPELIEQFSIFQKSFLKSTQFIVRIVHSIKVLFLMFVYLAKRFPRSINEIQSRVR